MKNALEYGAFYFKKMTSIDKETNAPLIANNFSFQKYTENFEKGAAAITMKVKELQRTNAKWKNLDK